MQSDLKKILRKAAKGHRQSQVHLYEDYYGYCMSVALRFSESRDEACEIVHDSFLKVFNKLNSLTNAASFKPWLRRIVVNTALDYYRKNANQVHHLDVIEHDTVSLEENALQQLSAEDIYEAISKLPQAYRMAFTLYAIEGFKHEEIADRLGISVGTSKSNLSKARVKLQGIILSMEEETEVSHG